MSRNIHQQRTPELELANIRRQITALERIARGMAAGGGGGGGVTDHGALTGLGDDDHLQYHTNARGDVRYVKADLTNVPAGLATQAELDAVAAAKANTSHVHAIADVTNLQGSLDAKAAASHTHAISQVTGLQAALDGKASTTHSHAIADVTGLQAALDAKAPVVSPTFTGAVTVPTAVAGTSAVNKAQMESAIVAAGGAVASDATPLVNGTAAAGDDPEFARGDHVHPTDTSRAPASAGVPIGGIIDYYGTTEPAGWLFPNGQAINASLYPDAATIIGANTPDLRGRVVAGLDNMGGTDAGRLDWTNTRGTTGGAQTHQLTSAQSGMPAHAHSPGAGSHWFYAGTGGNGGNLNVTRESGTTYPATLHTTIAAATAVNAAQAHNNMQPTMVMNKLIRVA